MACSKRSLTREAPTPTNISTKSDPLSWKKGLAASPATARAMRVLPVPGGPTRSIPLGILPPRVWYFSGSLRKSTTSISSTLASGQPATSAKVTLSSDSPAIFARVFPKDIAVRPIWPDWRIIMIHRKMIRPKGNTQMSMLDQNPEDETIFVGMFFSWRRSRISFLFCGFLIAGVVKRKGSPEGSSFTKGARVMSSLSSPSSFCFPASSLLTGATAEGL